MRILIKTYGHQSYEEREGEVVAWTQTTEFFHDGGNNSFEGNKAFQVPAVLLSDGKRVCLVPLKTERTRTDIEIITGSNG